MIKRFKTLGTTISLLLILILSVEGQVALNGTSEFFPYHGLQPQLIEGVTALPAVDEPLLRHVYLVDKNIVALTIDEKALIFANLKPYAPQVGDTIVMGDYHGLSKILERNGREIGYICGINNNWLRPYNDLTGKPLDINWLEQPLNISFTSDNDQAFRSEINPVKVYRKTYPIRRSHVSRRQQFSLRHEVYLVFEKSFAPGASYTIDFAAGGPLDKPVHFKFNDKRLRTEAIHVNLLGYAPAEPKVAFLSTWLGDGGSHSYDGTTEFHLVKNTTEEIVFTGKVKLKSKGRQPEYQVGDRNYNHNLTDVYTLDFSAFKIPGNYRVVVPGIGASFAFDIANTVWEKTAHVTMKGFLHQRSGIALGPPYTDYLRPRNMHPADEVTIHKCDVEKFFNPGGETEGG